VRRDLIGGHRWPRLSRGAPAPARSRAYPDGAARHERGGRCLRDPV